MAPQEAWGRVGDILHTESGEQQVIVGHDTAGSPEVIALTVFEQGKSAVVEYLGTQLGERAWRLASARTLVDTH